MHLLLGAMGGTGHPHTSLASPQDGGRVLQGRRGDLSLVLGLCGSWNRIWILGLGMLSPPFSWGGLGSRSWGFWPQPSPPVPARGCWVVLLVLEPLAHTCARSQSHGGRPARLPSGSGPD